MAIWQYCLIAVPKGSLQKDYKCIFTNNKTAFLPETESLWRNTNLNISEITIEIDKLLKRGSWSNDTFISWKSEKDNNEDNDCHISINEKTNRIKEFQFRVDLRETKNISIFLKEMLRVCDKNELILFNIKGKILNPKIETIIEDIKLSNSVAFLTDPIKYLESLK